MTTPGPLPAIAPAPAAGEIGLRLLLDSLADHAIYRLDPDGVIRDANQAAETIKGYSLAELIGRSFDTFFTPEDREAGLPAALLARARAEGRAASEGWRLRKDGARFWAQSTLQAIRGPGGELIGYAKVTRDFTTQHATQQALLESERRFRFLVEGVTDYAIYMLDPQGVVSNWNRGAERIKQYAADEIIGRHFSTFYAPEDRAAGIPQRALATALAEGRFEAEGWRIRKDGTRFWASVVIDPIRDDEGRHIGFAKITRDISERRAAQQALERSERQFRLLVASVVDYALFMLDTDGMVTNWNAGAQEIKGYLAPEIVGRHMSTFYTETDRAAGLPQRALATAAEKGRFESEGWRVRKDGSLFWASVVIDAIRDEQGEIIGFAKITRDITDRRNAQLELQKARERLAQAQKMEAIGQLTGGVAHDFNNLLMVVGGQAALLRRLLPDEPRAARAVDAIEMAARRGRDLTRHLLAFARRQRLRPEPVSLPDRAAALRELIAASLGPAVVVDIDIPADLWPVEVDPSEFELALLNLAVNARDAMPGGGALSITAANHHYAGGDESDLAGDFVTLTVRDTGPGMAPDILARVFEPFFTTKSVDKGTGLGLSQVYGFAQQSGGRAGIASEMGQGVTVTLDLPRAGSAPRPAADVAAAPAGVGVRILLVEDNPEVAEVAAGLLEQLGARVDAVSSAAAALAALVEGPRPDLVFSDIVMAGEQDGIELARRIRAEHPGLPVLLATGYSKAAEALGAEFPILAKPYHLDELSAAIGAVLAAAPSPGAPAP